MIAPHAPWALTGECLAGLFRARRVERPLPRGLSRFPGPCVVVAFRHADSPVGPYLELAIGEPARLGARPGLCFTTSVVTSPDARAGGRLNWGFPTELGDLRWAAHGDEIRVAWEERGIVLRGYGRGPILPVLVPLRSLQRRADGPVLIPGQARGRMRLAWLDLHVPSDDPLARAAGRHAGAHVTGMRAVVDPARLPSGLVSTFLAPLRAPEPALSSGGRTLSGD